MVNKCHAKRDTKTCSGVARHFLSCALASQLAFVLSIHCYLSFVIARLVPGNPVIKLSGVSRYHYRRQSRRYCAATPLWIPACRRE
ncbi:hypothetical protein [Candidatus Spongiihabitans sp.]|uniref:hypothetical protein n=1 Tax=Candidatus Spongiihabitans sp. TaxID=3101308 RepID=UPI003C79CBC5